MGIKRDNSHKGCAHCLVCGQSLKKFLSLSVSGVFGRKGQVPQTAAAKRDRVCWGLLVLYWTHTTSPSSQDTFKAHLFPDKKKKSSQRSSIHFCNYISFIDSRSCFSISLCAWEGQHLMAQKSHAHPPAVSPKRSPNAPCVQNSRLLEVENEILQGKGKHRDQAS